MKQLRVSFLMLGIIILVSAVILFSFSKDDTPIKEIESARHSISLAKSNSAETFSEELYKTSSMLYDSAVNLWRKQNEKMYWSRNFELTKAVANKAKVTALKANDLSKKHSKNSRAEFNTKIIKLKIQLKDIKPVLQVLSTREEILALYHNSELQLAEAAEAVKNDNLIRGWEKLKQAENLFESSLTQSKLKLNSYFRDFKEWNASFEALKRRASQKETYAIVVDKFARTCMLIRNGKIQKHFKVELGPNWIGDKQEKGDKATPEGYYTIIKKKAGKDTRFYKALLINYPSESDLKRISSLKKEGSLSTHSESGNLIEFHGGGGRDFDWTDGCIALKNEDMDILFSSAKEGTEVLIVGSLKSLKEIYPHVFN